MMMSHVVNNHADIELQTFDTEECDSKESRCRTLLKKKINVMMKNCLIVINNQFECEQCAMLL
jgi:hypothetical protein